MKFIIFLIDDIIFRPIHNFMFDIKEGWKMFRGHYRIEPIVYSKTLIKYSDIVTRRRRFIDENAVKRLTKAIVEFNKEVEAVNY